VEWGRWKDLKLNAAFHFPHPAFLEERHEVPLLDAVREVGKCPDFSDRYGRAMEFKKINPIADSAVIA
jgi:hypothetical protein